MSGKHSRLKAHELTSESQHFLPANMAIVILGKQRNWQHIITTQVPWIGYWQNSCIHMFKCEMITKIIRNFQTIVKSLRKKMTSGAFRYRLFC